MNDTRTASLVLVAGAAGVAWWYWHLTSPQGALASPAVPGGPSGPGTLSSNPVALGSPLDRLTAFAAQWGLPVISGYRPGANSLHGEGKAVDVPVPPASLQAQIEAAAAAEGIHIYPEAKGQVGANGSVSTGAHWHLSFPELRNGREVF